MCKKKCSYRIVMNRAITWIVTSVIMAALHFSFVGKAPAGLLSMGSVLQPVPAEVEPVGGVVIDSKVDPFVASTFTGTLTSDVISGDTSNSLGGLTFVYRVENNPGSAHAIGRFAVSDFGSFTTDVGYDPNTPAGGIVPLLANRTTSNKVVGFTFAGAEELAPSTTSANLVIHTDAMNYVDTLAVISNGSASTAATFVPLPVPEPSTWILAVLVIPVVLVKWYPRTDR